MGKPILALDYLKRVSHHPAQAVNVVFGDDAYLKQKAVASLCQSVTTGPDAEFAISRYDGSTVEWPDVTDRLATVTMFGGGQAVVVVSEAEDLISRERVRLENYVAQPDTNGILILVVTRWPKNTRLFKAISSSGLQVDCKTPGSSAIVKWLSGEATQRHDVSLTAGAGEQLLETLGPELGLLANELEKLALMSDGKITVGLVREMAGGWRAKTAWDMLDAAYAGNAPEALLQLQRLLQAGEHPVAILAQISASLRRLAAASRLYLNATLSSQKLSLRSALEQAGVAPYFLGKAEQQLKRLGRQRASSLYRWLLEADLQLKGESSSPDRARLVLEQLLIRIAASPTSSLRPRLATAS
ncbi:MAG: DNA polymerase III subunit delta [Planctomycetales bacterium]|nr:DNA polymerase III subunit delta [Planctomycetales bacterium]NIM09316.1 DNA polymerase III subunit delta [Planctomycetales bacterium]NIN08784.1 DNA polymerase III subunit delta [Planctomycetales bacterium]NIN77901.1 DNA polymerase III subunit delta [Planctomycetales bacterium]NIO35084.1 DNA polymerase III subunit delta [Planctomycetales bacterium]